MINLSSPDVLGIMPRYALLSLAVSAILLAIFVTAYFARLNAQQGLRQAAGSRVALAIGERFAPADRFTGFVHEESGSSLVIVELPEAAFEQLLRLGNNAAEAFAAQGVTDVALKTLPGRKGDTLYLQGRQKTSLVDYAKYILIFRENGLTGMVTANIPEAALKSGAVTASEIETVLKSATIRQDAPQAAKLFTLGYLGAFEEDLALLGTTKGYRLKGDTAPEDGKAELRPLFLVAPSLTQAPMPNLGLFSEQAFQSIEQVKNKKIENTQGVKVADIDGVEIFGSGQDARSGESALVYQMVLKPARGGYFRLVGLAPASERGVYLAEYRKMAQSFRLPE